MAVASGWGVMWLDGDVEWLGGLGAAKVEPDAEGRRSVEGRVFGLG